ncbi:MAG: DUF6586 family protein [Pseudomonadales bacterium]
MNMQYRITDAKRRLFYAQLDVLRNDQLTSLERQALEASQHYHLTTWYRAFIDEVGSHYGLQVGAERFSQLCQQLSQLEFDCPQAELLNELELQPHSWLAQALYLEGAASIDEFAGHVQLIGSSKKRDIDIIYECAVEFEKHVAAFRELMQEW